MTLQPEISIRVGKNLDSIQAGFSMGGEFLNSENKLDRRLHIPGQQ